MVPIRSAPLRTWKKAHFMVKVPAFRTRCVMSFVASTTAFERSIVMTMIYTHVLNRGGKGVKSPGDAFFEKSEWGMG